MTESRLSDLLDMSLIQTLADSNFRASGLPMIIVDSFDSSVLVKAGWPDTCRDLHGHNPLQPDACLAGSKYSPDRFGKADAFQCKCKSGLHHIAIPIMVAGRHMGTMFLTRFVLENQLPELKPLAGQAAEAGLDARDYLSAFDSIPVFSSEKIDYILAYGRALVQFIADLAERSLRMIETKESLGESEKKYRTLADNLNLGIYRKNPDLGKFMQINSAMPKIFGYASAEEFLNVPAASLYRNPDDRTSLFEVIRKKGFVKNMELQMNRKDGTPIWCSVTSSAQYSKKQELKWIDSVVEDITERKKAEDELIKAHRELEQRVMERTADLAHANELLMAEIAERKKVEEQLRDLSEKDHLTMIYNRRKLFEILALEVDKAKRYQRPLSMILLDLDYFKAINDRYGHSVGDAVLKETAVVVEAVIRKTDIFARYGGEEFIILSTETAIDGALALAEKVRSSIEKHDYPYDRKITVSAGVYELSFGDSVDSFIDKADRALYTAKKYGRNRVEKDIGPAG